MSKERKKKYSSMIILLKENHLIVAPLGKALNILVLLVMSEIIKTHKSILPKKTLSTQSKREVHQLAVVVVIIQLPSNNNYHWNCIRWVVVRVEMRKYS